MRAYKPRILGFLLVGCLSLSAVSWSRTPPPNAETTKLLLQGQQLSEKLTNAQARQQVLLQQKALLEGEQAALVREASDTEKAVAQYNHDAAAINGNRQALSEKCNGSQPQTASNQVPQQDLDKLSQQLRAAGLLATFSKTGVNANDQTPQFVGMCNSQIKQINYKLTQMGKETAPLQSRQQQLSALAAEQAQAVLVWSQQQQQLFTELNSVYQDINAWQQSAEDYMASDEFQEQIRRNGSAKSCRTVTPTGTQLQQMNQITESILNCLRHTP